MKTGIFFILCFICLNITFGYQEYISKDIDGKFVNIIKVVLDGKHKIVTAISQNGDTLEDLVKKEGGVSGVNGAYFCPADYAHCGGVNFTDAHRVYKGQKYFKYGQDFGARGMFGFDASGDVLFILNNLGYVPGINRKYNDDKIQNLYYGIANFPVLVFQGQNVVNESLMLLDWKMKTKGVKSFICVRADNKTVLMGNVADVTVEQLAEYLTKSLLCYNAINLDSGGSLGMIYNGKTIKKPSKKIMDAFVVVPVVENKKPVENKQDNGKLQNIDEIEVKYGSILKKLYAKLDEIKQKSPQKIYKIIEKINKIKTSLDKTSVKYKIILKIEEYCKELK